MSRKIPTDEEIGQNIQIILIRGGVDKTRWNRFLMSLWDLNSSHQVRRLLTGRSSLQLKHARRLAEWADIPLSAIFE